jgi:hypothetical protein
MGRWQMADSKQRIGNITITSQPPPRLVARKYDTYEN